MERIHNQQSKNTNYYNATARKAQLLNGYFQLILEPILLNFTVVLQLPDTRLLKIEYYL